MPRVRGLVEYANGDRVAPVAVVYDAEVVGGVPRPDGDETTAVRWFHPAELATLPLNTFARAAFAQLRMG